VVGAHGRGQEERSSVESCAVNQGGEAPFVGARDGVEGGGRRNQS
jgi:hypothetical protein